MPWWPFNKKKQNKNKISAQDWVSGSLEILRDDRSKSDDQSSIELTKTRHQPLSARIIDPSKIGVSEPNINRDTPPSTSQADDNTASVRHQEDQTPSDSAHTSVKTRPANSQQEETPITNPAWRQTKSNAETDRTGRPKKERKQTNSGGQAKPTPDSTREETKGDDTTSPSQTAPTTKQGETARRKRVKKNKDIPESSASHPNPIHNMGSGTDDQSVKPHKPAEQQVSGHPDHSTDKIKEENKKAAGETKDPTGVGYAFRSDRPALNQKEQPVSQSIGSPLQTNTSRQSNNKPNPRHESLRSNNRQVQTSTKKNKTPPKPNETSLPQHRKKSSQPEDEKTAESKSTKGMLGGFGQGSDSNKPQVRGDSKVEPNPLADIHEQSQTADNKRAGQPTKRGSAGKGHKPPDSGRQTSRRSTNKSDKRNRAQPSTSNRRKTLGETKKTVAGHSRAPFSTSNRSKSTTLKHQTGTHRTQSSEQPGKPPHPRDRLGKQSTTPNESPPQWEQSVNGDTHSKSFSETRQRSDSLRDSLSDNESAYSTPHYGDHPQDFASSDTDDSSAYDETYHSPGSDKADIPVTPHTDESDSQVNGSIPYESDIETDSEYETDSKQEDNVDAKASIPQKETDNNRTQHPHHPESDHPSSSNQTQPYNPPSTTGTQGGSKARANDDLLRQQQAKQQSQKTSEQPGSLPHQRQQLPENIIGQYLNQILRDKVNDDYKKQIKDGLIEQLRNEEKLSKLADTIKHLHNNPTRKNQHAALFIDHHQLVARDIKSHLIDVFIDKEQPRQSQDNWLEINLNLRSSSPNYEEPNQLSQDYLTELAESHSSEHTTIHNLYTTLGRQFKGNNTAIQSNRILHDWVIDAQHRHPLFQAQHQDAILKLITECHQANLDKLKSLLKTHFNYQGIAIKKFNTICQACSGHPELVTKTLNYLNRQPPYGFEQNDLPARFSKRLDTLYLEAMYGRLAKFFEIIELRHQNWQWPTEDTPSSDSEPTPLQHYLVNPPTPPNLSQLDGGKETLDAKPDPGSVILSLLTPGLSNQEDTDAPQDSLLPGLNTAISQLKTNDEPSLEPLNDLLTSLSDLPPQKARDRLTRVLTNIGLNNEHETPSRDDIEPALINATLKQKISNQTGLDVESMPTDWANPQLESMLSNLNSRPTDKPTKTPSKIKQPREDGPQTPTEWLFYLNMMRPPSSGRTTGSQTPPPELTERLKTIRPAISQTTTSSTTHQPTQLTGENLDHITTWIEETPQITGWIRTKQTPEFEKLKKQVNQLLNPSTATPTSSIDSDKEPILETIKTKQGRQRLVTPTTPDTKPPKTKHSTPSFLRKWIPFAKEQPPSPSSTGAIMADIKQSKKEREQPTGGGSATSSEKPPSDPQYPPNPPENTAQPEQTHTPPGEQSGVTAQTGITTSQQGVNPITPEESSTKPITPTTTSQAPPSSTPTTGSSAPPQYPSIGSSPPTQTNTAVTTHPETGTTTSKPEPPKTGVATPTTYSDSWTTTTSSESGSEPTTPPTTNSDDTPTSTHTSTTTSNTESIPSTQQPPNLNNINPTETSTSTGTAEPTQPTTTASQTTHMETARQRQAPQKPPKRKIVIGSGRSKKPQPVTAQEHKGTEYPTYTVTQSGNETPQTLTATLASSSPQGGVIKTRPTPIPYDIAKVPQTKAHTAQESPSHQPNYFVPLEPSDDDTVSVSADIHPDPRNYFEFFQASESLKKSFIPIDDKQQAGQADPNQQAQYPTGFNWSQLENNLDKILYKPEHGCNTTDIEEPPPMQNVGFVQSITANYYDANRETKQQYIDAQQRPRLNEQQRQNLYRLDVQTAPETDEQRLNYPYTQSNNPGKTLHFHVQRTQQHFAQASDEQYDWVTISQIVNFALAGGAKSINPTQLLPNTGSQNIDLDTLPDYLRNVIEAFKPNNQHPDDNEARDFNGIPLEQFVETSSDTSEADHPLTPIKPALLIYAQGHAENMTVFARDTKNKRHVTDGKVLGIIADKYYHQEMEDNNLSKDQFIENHLKPLAHQLSDATKQAKSENIEHYCYEVEDDESLRNTDDTSERSELTYDDSHRMGYH